MAVVKIHAIKSTINKSIEYILNPQKTEEMLYTSGYKVTPQTAAIEFKMTEELAKQIKGDYDNCGSKGSKNLGYHLIQSFAVGEVSPKQALSIGKEFADNFLKGQHEYVIATHIDKAHIHNHIIINATSFNTYKKLETKPYKTIAQLRDISDKLCKDNGLSIINTKGKGITYIEWKLNKNKVQTWKEFIKAQIDVIIDKVTTYAEFKIAMEKCEIDIKEGKYISFKAPGQERYCRGKTIGADYEKDAIISKIEKSNKTLNIRSKTITLNKVLIKKKLPNGFVTRIPGSKAFVFLSAADTRWIKKDITLEITLRSDKIYNMCNLAGEKIAIASYEDLIKPYDDKTVKVMSFSGNFNNITGNPCSIELLISRLQHKQNKKAMLHNIADSLHIARNEKIVYLNDFTQRKNDIRLMIKDIEKELTECENKVELLRNTCKYAATVEKYQSTVDGYNKAWNKAKYKNKYAVELAAYDYAADQLSNAKIHLSDVDLKQLVVDIKTAEQQIKSLNKYVSVASNRLEVLERAENMLQAVINSTKEKNIEKQKNEIER